MQSKHRILLSLLLALLMALAAIPLGLISVAAACNHVHDDICGYAEGISECKHVHDAACGGSTPGGFTPGGNPGDTPGNGGEGPGSGGTDAQPQQPPVPPGKEPPKEPPIEIEVDPELDADLKPKKKKMKELEKQTVWTISLRNARNAVVVPNKYLPQYADMNYVLNFTATKKSGADKTGDYTGKGSLSSSVDASRLQAQVAQNFQFQNFLMNQEGPIEQVSFRLGIPEPEDDLAPLEVRPPAQPKDDLAPLGDSDDLAPLGDDDDLAPLDTAPSAKLVAVSYPIATWQAKSNALADGVGLEYGDYHSRTDSTETPITLNMRIEAYDSGRAKIFFNLPNAARTVEFWGTISKKISWKEVK